MTPCSHYHFWMFPSRMAAYRDKYLTFDAATDAEREEFLQALDKVIRIALYVSGKKRFLSKNPPHTGRVRMLLERYPGARFIYLIRNPYVVFESTQHFFRSTLDAIRMQEITQSELTREILLNYRALYEHYEADKRLIPEGQLVEVRFEELENAPLPVAERIYDRLSLGDFDRVKPAMERFLDSQRGFRRKNYVFDLQTTLTVEQFWGEAVRQWNYHP